MVANISEPISYDCPPGRAFFLLSFLPFHSRTHTAYRHSCRFARTTTLSLRCLEMYFQPFYSNIKFIASYKPSLWIHSPREDGMGWAFFFSRKHSICSYRLTASHLNKCDRKEKAARKKNTSSDPLFTGSASTDVFCCFFFLFPSSFFPLPLIRLS